MNSTASCAVQNVPGRRKLGLAHQKARRANKPRAQSKRWDLLDRAIAIDRTAAL
ncbi:MAG: hypothetical protein ACR2PF_11780 [Rhizobiaceae bacterium]